MERVGNHPGRLYQQSKISRPGQNRRPEKLGKLADLAQCSCPLTGKSPFLCFKRRGKVKVPNWELWVSTVGGNWRTYHTPALYLDKVRS